MFGGNPSICWDCLYLNSCTHPPGKPIYECPDFRSFFIKQRELAEYMGIPVRKFHNLLSSKGPEAIVDLFNEKVERGGLGFSKEEDQGRTRIIFFLIDSKRSLD